MLKRFCVLIALLSVCQVSQCADKADNSEIRSAASRFAAGLSVVDERLEEAVVRDTLTGGRFMRQVRGIVGESKTDEALAHYLNRRGNVVWQSLTPRTGPQGLDHLFVKYDESGMPVDFLVAESKWGTSRLGNTRDGIQMGNHWTKSRLEKIGQRYEELAANEKVSCRRIPAGKNPNVKMSLFVRGRNGKLVERFFWRENSLEKWYYSGFEHELRAAQNASRCLGRLYKAGATGRIGYRRSVYHWDISGTDLVLRIDAMDKFGVISKGTIENGRAFTFKDGAYGRISAEAIEANTRLLKKSVEYRDWDIKELRRMIGKESYKAILEQSRFCILASGAKTAGTTGVVAMGIDAAIQVLFNKMVDWNRVAEAGMGATAAVGAGEVAGLTVMKAGIGSRSIRIGAKVGAMTVAFSAYDFYRAYNGNMSWEEASVNASISGLSVGAGALTSAALMALPGMLGVTASTGTAIASLSGAAYTSSTLAFYGGGSLAAGGFGAAGGMIVVGGVAFIAAAGVAASAMWGYAVYKDNKEWSLAKEWGEWLNGHVSEVQRLKNSSR